MKKLILPICIWILIIFAINKISVKVIPDRTSYELPAPIPFTFTLAPLLNMDGRIYQQIACRGYGVENGGSNLTAFFPVYPLLIKAISLNCAINPVLVGLLISSGGFLVSLFTFWKLVEKEIRFKSFLLMLFFPTSFFFLAYYTESLFLLLSLLVFWFIKKKKLLLASIFAAIATATRVFGLALVAAIIYEAFIEYKKNHKIHFEILTAPLGIVGYAVYNWMASGNPLAFIASQSHWDRPVGLLAPIYAIKSQITAIVSGPLPSYDSPFVYPVIVIEFMTLIYLITVLVVAYKKIDASYWVYLLASIVIILFGGILSAAPRYSLVLFPIYIYLAKHLSGVKYVMYLTVSLILLIFMAGLFLRGYWVS